MTAPMGWLSERFGRKKLFIICVGGFTVASFLCALAQNIEQMVLFRLLQGMMPPVSCTYVVRKVLTERVVRG